MENTESSTSDYGQTEGVPGTLSTAVREHLQKLCLHEFPCGIGSWVRAPTGEGARKGRTHQGRSWDWTKIAAGNVLK